MGELDGATEAEGPTGVSVEDEGRSGLRELVFLAIALTTSAGVLAYLNLAHGVELDEATLALAVACAVLLYALRSMFAVVSALGRPSVELLLARDAAFMGTVSELRADRRRVLRAIKELDFDFEMGKLNQRDYGEIRDRYRVRAVELQREIDGASRLHTSTERLLRRVGRDGKCSGCGAATELDARFCAGCGEALDGESSTAPAVEGGA